MSILRCRVLRCIAFLVSRRCSLLRDKKDKSVRGKGFGEPVSYAVSDGRGFDIAAESAAREGAGAVNQVSPATGDAEQAHLGHRRGEGAIEPALLAGEPREGRASGRVLRDVPVGGDNKDLWWGAEGLGEEVGIPAAGGCVLGSATTGGIEGLARDGVSTDQSDKFVDAEALLRHESKNVITRGVRRR